MKKIILLVAFVALTTVSCTKDRTCTCTTTNSGGGTAETETTTLVGTTKGQGKANCITVKYTSGTNTVTRECKLS